jgi:GDPmannose 4,6-dehydratase
MLMGDYSKAKRELGWEPKTSFDDLVRLMVDSDLELLRRQARGLAPGDAQHKRGFHEVGN